MNSSKKILLMFIIACLSLLDQQAFGLMMHKFSLGHVERSVNVVVRDREVMIEYSVGMSDETIAMCLRQWKVAAVDLKEEQVGPPGSATRESTQGAASETTSQAIESAKQQPAVTVNGDGAQADDDELTNETQIVGLLQKYAPERLGENLQLVCNGEQIPLEVVEAGASPRHHVSLSIVFRATLPDGIEKLEFKLIDSNFLDIVRSTDESPLIALSAEDDHGKVEAIDEEVIDEEAIDKETIGRSGIGQSENDQAQGTPLGLSPDPNTEEKSNRAIKETRKLRFNGSTRLALRVKGAAILLNSNVVPVLIRAKAIDLGPLESEARIEANTIVARIGFSEK